MHSGFRSAFYLSALLLVIILLSILDLPFRPTSAQAPPAQTLLISGAIVVDGTGAAPVRADVLIRGDRIVEVGANLAAPPGARVINGAGKTLIPGLFDLHTHLPYSSVGGLTGNWAKNLKAYLYCGVTSVVDFGTYPETFGPMRKLIAEGVVDSPRLILAARMTTPGGHGAEGGRSEIFTLEVSTPEAARAALRRVLPYRPDAIKVFTDGWRYGQSPDMSSMNEETLTALVAEAHTHGLKVLTHTVTLERAKIAARAGVDVIAHGIGDAEADQELIDLLKSKGTTYASTLAVYEPRGRELNLQFLAHLLEPLALAALERTPAPARAAPRNQASNPAQTDVQSARQRRWRILRANVARLRGSSARLGVGTDAGVTGTHHGWATLRELQLLVSAGLTPAEAIHAATGASAIALGVEAERGTIKAGRLADLVLVDGAPEKDISRLERIERVFLGGRELDRARLARAIADPAYNPYRPLPARPQIDDFERADGRSRVDSLWINGTESGHDHSRVIFGRTRRAAGGQALTALARMAGRERSFVTLSLPLSPGAVVPVDASAYRGIRFEARGEGTYQLLAVTQGVRDGANFQTDFRAGARWQLVTIPFASLQQPANGRPVAWTGTDLLMLTFRIAPAGRDVGWLELDNLYFYR